MPNSLPFPVFVRRLLGHGVRNLFLYCRALLVCSVWLFWLPWSTRSVWRFLFWIGDGRWYWQDAGNSTSNVTTNVSVQKDMIALTLGAATTTVSAVGDVSKAMQSLANAQETRTALPKGLNAISQTLNMSYTPSFLTSLSFNLGRMIPLFSSTADAPVNSTIINATISPVDRHPSWLSEVDFLKNLTRYPMFNKFLIDTIEGEIITLVVVVAFILVFLIREWVVQQQPGLDMRARLDAENVDAVLRQGADPPAPAPAEPFPGGDPDDEGPVLADMADLARQGALDRQDIMEIVEGLGPRRRDVDGDGRRPVARPRRRVHFPPEEVAPEEFGFPHQPTQEEPEADEEPAFGDFIQLRHDADSLRFAEKREQAEQRQLAYLRSKAPESTTNSFGTRLEDGEIFSFQSGPSDKEGESSSGQRPALTDREEQAKAADILRVIEGIEPHRRPELLSILQRPDGDHLLKAYLDRNDLNHLAPSDALSPASGELDAPKEHESDAIAKLGEILGVGPSKFGHESDRKGKGPAADIEEPHHGDFNGRASELRIANNGTLAVQNAYIDTQAAAELNSEPQRPFRAEDASDFEIEKVGSQPSPSWDAFYHGSAARSQTNGTGSGLSVEHTKSVLMDSKSNDFVGEEAVEIYWPTPDGKAPADSVKILVEDYLQRQHSEQDEKVDQLMQDHYKIQMGLKPVSDPDANTMLRRQAVREIFDQAAGLADTEGELVMDIFIRSQIGTLLRREARDTEDPSLNSSGDELLPVTPRSNSEDSPEEAQMATPSDSVGDSFELAQLTDDELIARLGNEGRIDMDFPENSGPAPGQEQQVPPPPQGILEWIIGALWDGVLEENPLQEVILGDDEHVVQDMRVEAPFVPIVNNQLQAEAPIVPNNNNNPPPPAALDLDPFAGGDNWWENGDANDQDAIEDGEDFDGIMELIGMRGQLVGLFQNGMFCAILISATVFGAIWIPYIWGKIVILFAANPTKAVIGPLQWTSWAADFTFDSGLFLVALCGMIVDALIRGVLSFASKVLPFLDGIAGYRGLEDASGQMLSDSVDRIVSKLSLSPVQGVKTEAAFSVLSHEALLEIKAKVNLISSGVFWIGRAIFAQYPEFEALRKLQPSHFVKVAKQVNAWGHASTIYALSFKNFNPFEISFDLPERSRPIDMDLAHWGAWDRFLAIVAGYTLFALIGALYLRSGPPWSSSEKGKKFEKSVTEILQQAGGVLKVILIIGIEMIVFPLYCGLLLDMALLPLFEKATFMSRFMFTIDSPCTSAFLHWFVGTCYMFHFALFVSMCRKIMRSGVLCKFSVLFLSSGFIKALGFDVANDRFFVSAEDFIRDPDDPTFHPVRDVLERTVTTQLRKIAFSALVYGALVMVCLGAVVWSLFYVFDGILPIHWSSDEPVLEFPVDLLFYNFLMPLAIKFFKPSDGLHAMYSWWFKICARKLRLSWFLFDDRHKDQEGYYSFEWYKSYFRGAGAKIEFGDDVKEVGAELEGISPDLSQQTSTPSSYDDTLPSEAADVPIQDSNEKGQLDSRTEQYFVRTGRYVRAPASDQIRIPKGTRVFLDVTEDNERLDGIEDRERGLHGKNSDAFKVVYIPPWFRTRIALFIISIWLFAAVTGVSITIVPLVFGRMIFARVIPKHTRMNDVYAFSIGIYFLGGITYLAVNYEKALQWMNRHVMPAQDSTARFGSLLISYTIRALRLFYTYAAFAFVLPSLFALLMEFYFIIPMHTYLAAEEKHVIHFIQDWTLGVLYVKMAGRFILWYANSRPAGALRAITRDGWLNPNVRIATRCFILPATIVMAGALVLPLPLGWLANRFFFSQYEGIAENMVYRYSYPAVLTLIALFGLSVIIWQILQSWRRMIRDEVYLIGERLHNFGEKKPVEKERELKVAKFTDARA
jgi:hypothetical protein